MSQSLSVNQLEKLLDYDKETGKVRTKRRRELLPDHDGLVVVFDNSSKKSYKLKLDKIAYALGYGVLPRKDQKILHKNLNSEDNRLRNLCVVSSKTYLQIKEAQKNLSVGIKLDLHPEDQFSYIVSWYEQGVHKQKTLHDIIQARKEQLRLQLKFSKILTKYCVFD